MLDSIKGPWRPLFIISFDESHILTDNPEGTGWTLFSQLRRVFRRIIDYPIFSLFLWTAARLAFQAMPGPFGTDRKPRPPFVTFNLRDQFRRHHVAYPTGENTVSLRRVVEMIGYVILVARCMFPLQATYFRPH